MYSFRLLLAASTTSSLGNGMRWVALPLLAAGMSADSRAVSLVTASEQLPWLLFGLIAGVIADRSDRKAVMWRANIARGLAMAAFAVAVWTDRASIWLIALVGFAITCGDALGGAAFAGLLPSLLPADKLRYANSRMEAGYLIADPLVGSVLGALLFGVAAVLPFGLDALTFFVAAFLVVLVPGSYRAAARDSGRGASRSVRTEAVEGLRFLWRCHPLRTLCGLLAYSNLIESGLVAVLVLYASRVLHLSSVAYGLLIAAFAVGGVTGALLAPRLAGRFGERAALLIAIGCCVLSTAALALAAGFAMAAAAVALYGAATSLWNLVTVTVRQTLVPDALMGRVMNSMRMVVLSVTPVGAVAGGFLAHAAGLRAPFAVGAVALTGAFALAVVAAPAAVPAPAMAADIPAVPH